MTRGEIATLFRNEDANLPHLLRSQALGRNDLTCCLDCDDVQCSPGVALLDRAHDLIVATETIDKRIVVDCTIPGERIEKPEPPFHDGARADTALLRQHRAGQPGAAHKA